DTTYSKTTLSDISLGENSYLWTVSNGYCPVAYDTVMILVNNIVVPTLITPNMDGRNDYFVIKGLESLGTTELDVFDRRGVRVYRNSDYDNSWNGVDYNDKPLRDDTYFYVLRSVNGKSVSGYIVIRH
ncbi:MAG TPA: gliding motility-associated C-terminal domain-containing protein, partial [Bacteroidales bacterium]|nr:gliding motility-associated C-terminal domain-containing protein [Bacteroidales bacterium]